MSYSIPRFQWFQTSHFFGFSCHSPTPPSCMRQGTLRHSVETGRPTTQQLFTWFVSGKIAKVESKRRSLKFVPWFHGGVFVDQNPLVNYYTIVYCILDHSCNFKESWDILGTLVCLIATYACPGVCTLHLGIKSISQLKQFCFCFGLSMVLFWSIIPLPTLCTLWHYERVCRIYLQAWFTLQTNPHRKNPSCMFQLFTNRWRDLYSWGLPR